MHDAEKQVLLAEARNDAKITNDLLSTALNTQISALVVERSAESSQPMDARVSQIIPRGMHF